MKSRPSAAGRNAQLVRTLQLLRELERSDGLTLNELAERFGTTPRTIYRDLGALQEAGYPLASDQDGKQKRWRLDTRAQARKLNALVDKGHFLALRVAMGQGGAVRENATLFGALEDLSDKIERALGPRGRQQLAAIDACFYSYEKHAYQRAAPDLLWSLVAAIAERRVCELEYGPPLGRTRVATFEALPLKLFAYRGGTYMMCHILRRSQIRSLNLQRVKRLRVLERSAEVPADFDPEAVEQSAFGVYAGGEPVRYRLRFAAAVAMYVRERVWHPSQTLRELPDGSVELCFTTGRSWEVSAWVASFRHRVEVCEPAQLRDELCALGARWARQYGDGTSSE